jgi:hypothetical protein
MKGTFPKPSETHDPPRSSKVHSVRIPRSQWNCDEAPEAAYPGLPKVEMFARRSLRAGLLGANQAPWSAILDIVDHHCLSCGEVQAKGTGAICPDCMLDNQAFESAASQAREGRSETAVAAFHFGIPLIEG